MSTTKGIVTPASVQRIADGIRYANGSDTEYLPSEMGAAVRALKKTLVSKTATENGTYDPADDNADGYNEFIVDVQGGGGVGDVFCLIRAEDLDVGGQIQASKSGATLAPYSTSGDVSYFVLPVSGTWTFSSSSNSKTVVISLDDFFDSKEVQLGVPRHTDYYHISFQQGDKYKYRERSATRVLASDIPLVWSAGKTNSGYVSPIFYSLKDYTLSDVISGSFAAKGQVSITDPENPSVSKVLYMYGSMNGGYFSETSTLYDSSDNMLLTIPGNNDFFGPYNTDVNYYNNSPLEKRINFYKALLKTE